jgi:hypothetical protein
MVLNTEQVSYELHTGSADCTQLEIDNEQERAPCKH